MSQELEAAATASVGGWLRWRRRQADIPPGTPCANCQTPLVGTYCHGCGQLAEDFHKSIWTLAREALESFFHLDGRLARTAPRLILKPGALTRDYLDGKRASQTPPLRLFLVILLATFLVGQCAAPDTLLGSDGAGVAAAQAEIAADPTLSGAERQAALAATKGDWRGMGEAVRQLREAELAETGRTLEQDLAARPASERWLAQRLEAIQSEPGRFGLLLGIWAQRMAILALPVSALILTGLFFWRRDVFVFDHVIFSMHSLSFQLLLLGLILALWPVMGSASSWLFALSPVHLFAHMRGAYGGGAVMTLMRMFVLFIATSVAAGFMLMLWLFLAFNEMRG